MPRQSCVIRPRDDPSLAHTHGKQRISPHQCARQGIVDPVRLQCLVDSSHIVHIFHANKGVGDRSSPRIDQMSRRVHVQSGHQVPFLDAGAGEQHIAGVVAVHGIDLLYISSSDQRMCFDGTAIRYIHRGRYRKFVGDRVLEESQCIDTGQYEIIQYVHTRYVRYHDYHDIAPRCKTHRAHDIQTASFYRQGQRIIIGMISRKGIQCDPVLPTQQRYTGVVHHPTSDRQGDFIFVGM